MRRAAFVVALLLFAAVQTCVPTSAHTRAAVSDAPSDSGLAQHEASEGFRLTAASGETVSAGPPCPSSAPRRTYHVVAISVDITLNRYLDHDPNGRMYVLQEELARVRAEEAANARARKGLGPPAVSLGLQGDAIQPLTLRALPGECLELDLRNALPDSEPASIHVHGSALRVASDGSPAIATNPKAYAQPGQTVSYQWMIPADEREGTHYFHSHGNDREQTNHGLFGAVIVEPKGSRWLDPLNAGPLRAGWQAMIEDPAGPDFREIALYYHEVGNEGYQLSDGKGGFLPLADPILGDYRPASRALNYRSEPFMDRMKLQLQLTGRFDESLAYSSYAFGDPATPIARSYLGDPIKQRIIHAGSEVAHVHHVHGGSIRWRRQPDAEASGFASGLTKHPPLTPAVTERTDSQSIGPSETFDLASECGSGGCQGSVGDYLIHCHVAQHYFAGMWGIWRVYNTLQDGTASTDSLPPLRELPDRAGGRKPAVPSPALSGRTVTFFGRRSTVKDLKSWVEAQLPPRGRPKGYDASVLDWTWKGTRALGEPEVARAWPGYAPRAPRARPAFLFDPATGKLAYPFLRPHLARRPPFAPNHGPAPFLDPATHGTDPPAPGSNGPASLCPAGTRVRSFFIDAISVPLTINRRDDLVDPSGMIYVLRDQEQAVLRNPALRVPLAIRANAGQDCIDIVFANEIPDTEENHGFSKVDVHIHFVQFDLLASDGVITGFNYEQSVRPYRDLGARLIAPVAAGARTFRAHGTHVAPGAVVGIGLEPGAHFESARVAAVSGDEITLDAPLRFAHATKEWVSAEFVRYRWYPDVQFGTAYFHDHVNALRSWRHGLYGALIAEPPGSSYHDPASGALLESGPIADIHTAARVSADVTGSFREMVMFIADDQPITSIGRSSGSVLNLRAEPLDPRARGDPSMVFASARGDPETPVMRAYLGDPIVVRTLVGGTNDVHTWHLDGHWFRSEPWSKTSPPIDTIRVGISERFDLVVPAAGGPQRMPGDYLYSSGRSFKLREGSWGMLRVLPGPVAGGLEPLPGHSTIPAAATSVCPAAAPVKRFNVDAVSLPLPMLNGRDGLAYEMRGARRAEPLVLHADVGDCLKVSLRNRTGAGPVTFHADMLASDPAQVAVGREPGVITRPGQTQTYTFYAAPEIGETVSLVRDLGDVVHNPGLGLFGAIVIGVRGTTWREAGPGAASWSAVAYPPHGSAYRDFALFQQDADAGLGTHLMPYSTKPIETLGVNYQRAPMTIAPSWEAAFTSASRVLPPTPTMQANVHDPVRVHVLAPSSEQAQVFSMEEQSWQVEPGLPGSRVASSTLIGGLEALTLRLEGGAGGREGLAGDYVWGDHREPFREAGMWGLFRVRARCAGGIRPLRGRCGVPWLPIGIAIGVVAVAVAMVARKAWIPRSREGSTTLPG